MARQRRTVHCLVACAVIASVLPGPLATGAADTPEQVDYAIVVTGNELLAVAFPDAHTVFLTRTLQPLGFHCVGSFTVDDKSGDIQEALRFFQPKTALIIVTGGLGPTDNDVTRESLAAFTGIGLEEHPDVLRDMERRFNTPREQLRANLRRQTRVPVRGTYLKSQNGTCVGLVFEMPKLAVVALPGPPRELQPMVRNELVPYLNRRFGTRQPGSALMLRFVGLGQSQIDYTIKQHITLPSDLTTYSQFEGGRVDFTYVLPHDTPQDRARLQALKRQILEHLRDNVYAEDDTTLEQVVARKLESHGASLAVAEVGGGSGLATALSGVAKADRVLAGAYAAPTEERLRRLLRIPDATWASAPAGAARAELLASAAAEATSSPWAIAIGESRRDKDGNPRLDAAFRRPDGSRESLSLPARGSGELARQHLTTQLLDQLRRRLK